MNSLSIIIITSSARVLERNKLHDAERGLNVTQTPWIEDISDTSSRIVYVTETKEVSMLDSAFVRFDICNDPIPNRENSEVLKESKMIGLSNLNAKVPNRKSICRLNNIGGDVSGITLS